MGYGRRGWCHNFIDEEVLYIACTSWARNDLLKDNGGEPNDRERGHRRKRMHLGVLLSCLSTSRRVSLNYKEIKILVTINVRLKP
jgi:hypothetical protein